MAAEFTGFVFLYVTFDRVYNGAYLALPRSFHMLRFFHFLLSDMVTIVIIPPVDPLGISR